jgi:serine/threonine protein kinase/tetratricopeptide (TPR) repeat protein
LTSRPEWSRVEAALDEFLDTPREKWASALADLTANDAALGREVESLLVQMDGTDAVLDRPILLPEIPAEPSSTSFSLSPGTRVGVYGILEFIGRGGMGEVYRAERADGQFEQQVALKLIRREAGAHLERFHVERQILARLEHPNIARLLDGGLSEDGRPYMVMELVEGKPIMEWCRENQSNLAQRLQLFTSICEAVAYAHRNLMVHRDIKPSNLLVRADGSVKLLDFGVARLLDPERTDYTQNAPLTPAYAAPEQLTQGPITTATDVYSLGLLLFELLTEKRLWQLADLSIALALEKVLHSSAPTMSEVASAELAPVRPAQLRGDLDAIVSKCLRKEPEARYETVVALQQDIERSRRSEPVSAREGARLYVVRQYLRRHRVLIASTSLVLLMVIGGSVGIAIQAARAHAEAARATAVKNFLVQVFRASDPRVASDKPRGQITAKELLDRSSSHIEQEFASQPELQLELLGIVGDIYGYLLDDDRYSAILKERVAIARRLHGDHDPVVIEASITDAWAYIYSQDFAKANHLLDDADRLLREAHLDETTLRADWWLAKGRALGAKPGAVQERLAALDRATKLYAKYDPLNSNYAAALANSANEYYHLGDYSRSATLNRQALDASAQEPDRSDMDMALVHTNLAVALEMSGQLDEAEAAYDKAAALVRGTMGEQYPSYWYTEARHARLIHMRGNRAGALARFEAMLKQIPADWKTTTDDALARYYYGERLAAEGRAQEAITQLEAARKPLTERPMRDFDLRKLRIALGDAYDRAGRIDEAREIMSLAVQEFIAREPANSPDALEARERWARFNLDHQSEAGAQTAESSDLAKVIADAGARAADTSAVALAHADLARLAVARGDAGAAASESESSQRALDAVRALHDVRNQTYIWRVRSQVAAFRGDESAAHTWSKLVADAEARDSVQDAPEVGARPHKPART